MTDAAVAGNTVSTATLRNTTDTSTTLRHHPAVNECDHPKPEWLFCDDFETNRLGRYFEYTGRDSSFQRVAGAGILGSFAMRAHFARGQTDAGSLKIAFGKTPAPRLRPVTGDTMVYRELYWRLYLRTDSSWSGGGGDKLSRAVILVDSHWAQAVAAHVWSGRGNPGANYLVLDPASGTDKVGTVVTTHYNDFAHLRWLGAQRGHTPLFDAAHTGRWYCIEAHARLNDVGQANGVFELWIDDQAEARREGLNWVGRYTTYGFNAVFIENYWNAGSPAAQSRAVDNIVVSTKRIGCGG